MKQSLLDDVPDAEMEEDQSNNNGEQEQGTNVPELTIKQAEGDKQNATYSFLNEDHTLGNLLRNQIIKNNNVEFCAYSVPHPSEPIMNVRIQCYPPKPNDDGTSDSQKVLNHGLKRISKMCDVLSSKFTDNLEKFEAKD